MIVFDRVTMTVTAHSHTRTVLSSVSLAIPSDRCIALLGSSNEDKQILINLLCGLILPRVGRIVRTAKVSFPVGHLGGFVTQLSVRKNVAHLARLYNADVDVIVSFVERVCDLGDSFDKPYGLLSNLKRRQLARIIAYGIPFDVYVLTEEGVRGKKREGDVAHGLFLARARTAGMIIPTHNPRFAREYCEMAIVLGGGKLQFFDQIEQGLSVFQHIAETSR